LARLPPETVPRALGVEISGPRWPERAASQQRPGVLPVRLAVRAILLDALGGC